jgi:hypothetical protein
MKAYVLGNRTVEADNRPVSLLPRFRAAFPGMVFEETDPTEEFTPEKGSVIIDTVQGIRECTWFDSLDSFEESAHVSVHDYDLYLHLMLLQKIGRLPRIRIFGIPQQSEESSQQIMEKFGRQP